MAWAAVPTGSLTAKAAAAGGALLGVQRLRLRLRGRGWRLREHVLRQRQLPRGGGGGLRLSGPQHGITAGRAHGTGGDGTICLAFQRADLHIMCIVPRLLCVIRGRTQNFPAASSTQDQVCLNQCRWNVPGGI